MIARLSGTLIAKQPPHLVIDVGGVGYEVEAPLTVFYDLPETGQPVTLLTHLQVRDDAHDLYGFRNEAERALFRQLLKISGIGAKLALTILSGASGDDLARFVAEDDTASLTRLPGIGKKTAERIIIELRDKLEDLGLSAGPAGSETPARVTGAAAEADHALRALGFKPAEASRMIRKVIVPDMQAEEIIRRALKSTVTS
ncbi:MAG: Holliday junction branch migration protein RuvA [Xanthomonadales bacterium]|nr:Holliday junction branch migration protein RuvA [Xanthomonadales bacterium]